MPLCGASCKLRWCEAVKARVWSLGVVVDPPCFDDFAGFGQASKQMLVEAFIAQPAVEGLDETILGGLTRCDVVPFDPVLLLPFEHGARGQLGAVIADDHARSPTHLDDPVEFARDTNAGDGVIGDEGQAFPAEVIDHGEDAESAATSERIGHKVDGPALVRALRGRHWSPCSQRTLAPAAFAHHQPFLAIEPVELLPVQHDAFAPEHKVQAPVAEPPSLRSQFLQPLPEPRIVRPLRDIAVGLRRQADQPARTPLRVVSVLDRPAHGRSPRPGR